MSTTDGRAPAFACAADALDPATRAAHFAWIRHELPALLRSVAEQPDGLVLQLPIETLAAVATFIDRERRCCPFLHFRLDLAPASDALELCLTGPEGVSAFLRAEFNLPVEATRPSEAG